MNKITFLQVVTITLLFLSTDFYAQKATFIGLGDFSGGVFSSSAQAVSADGKVIIGYGTTESGEQAFRWTESTGMVSLGNLPDSSFKKSWTNGVSANGKVIVGYGDPVGSGWNTYKGFIWTDTSGMAEIGSLDGSTRSVAHGVSADGLIVVGDGGPEAFRWEKETGTEGLGALPNRTHSRAIDISHDGSVVIGQSYTLPAWNDEDGFILTSDGNMQSMSSLTGGKYCMVLAVSPDGSVIAGTTNSLSTYPAFFWTEDKGFVTIGHLPGKNTTHPNDMTPYGKVIVGGSYSGPENSEAFIWDSINGMRNLKTVLQTVYGLDLTGWTLKNATGISPDGKVIVGQGKNPSGNQEAFRVVFDTLFSGTSGEENHIMISDINLKQNYPNPFNPSTTISYRLSENSNVQLIIYNSLGQEIKTLVDSFQNAGEYSITWNATTESSYTVSPGVYLLSLVSDEKRILKKMILR